MSIVRECSFDEKWERDWERDWDNSLEGKAQHALAKAIGVVKLVEKQHEELRLQLVYLDKCIQALWETAYQQALARKESASYLSNASEFARLQKIVSQIAVT